jgi:hypothetical protein
VLGKPEGSLLEASGAPGPVPVICCVFEAVIKVTTAETDIPEFSIAEPSENVEGGFALVTRDGGGDPAVDEAADARQKDVYSTPDEYRAGSIAWGGVEHGHGNFLNKAGGTSA